MASQSAENGFPQNGDGVAASAPGELTSEIIDLTHLRRYTAGDLRLEIEILSLFEEQASVWSRVLDPNGEDQAWRDGVHTLKGAARGVGAWAVSDLCARAESLVGEENLVARAVILQDLRRALIDAADEVRRLKKLSA
ncbi:MAG: Hpt domain-containing protein [Pseudomonadota bacterium]